MNFTTPVKKTAGKLCDMDTIEFHPIGVIHSPYSNPIGMPIQTQGAKNTPGTITLNEQYKEGLLDLDGFSHLILLYHFHLSKEYKLTVKPYLDDVPHGVFATRAPKRPNPIGLSIVRLEKIEDTVLHILDVDIVDGTPLLDIKPYVPQFNPSSSIRSGWLTDKASFATEKKSDTRI